MNLNIDVTLETPSLTSMIAEFREQLPFATALAVNRTADEAIKEARRELPSLGFHIRDPRFADFMFRQVSRATKANPEAVVGITGPKAPYFTRHVDGGVFTRDPDIFSEFFIPTTALRPDPMTVIPRAMYPANLRLLPKNTASGVLPARGRQTRKGRPMLQGKNGTFVVDSRPNGGKTVAIFQRTGPGPRDLVMLWRFTPRIDVPARLPLEQIITRVVEERFGLNLEGFLEYAISTAK